MSESKLTVTGTDPFTVEIFSDVIKAWASFEDQYENNKSPLQWLVSFGATYGWICDEVLVSHNERRAVDHDKVQKMGIELAALAIGLLTQIQQMKNDLQEN